MNFKSGTIIVNWLIKKIDKDYLYHIISSEKVYDYIILRCEINEEVDEICINKFYLKEFEVYESVLNETETQ